MPKYIHIANEKERSQYPRIDTDKYGNHTLTQRCGKVIGISDAEKKRIEYDVYLTQSMYEQIYFDNYWGGNDKDI